MHVRRKQVCIIGAGVSGLAAASRFKQKGHAVTLVETSSHLGGVWNPSARYPGVQTQSPKELYRYTDQAMPDSYPEWPQGSQVHAYLVAYARRHALDEKIRFDTKVCAIRRRDDGQPGWTVELLTTKAAGTRYEEEDFDFVVVCTGQFNDPKSLALPGEDDFKARGGVVVHSSQYNASSLATGRSVVVLGGSKSAHDIAVNAVRNGAKEVTIVYRDDVWRIPYFIGGLINFKRILYIRAREIMFVGWALSLFARFLYVLMYPLIWMEARGLEALITFQLSLKACKMVPNVRLEDSVNCSVPIATPGFHAVVVDGRIKARRGTTLAAYAESSTRGGGGGNTSSVVLTSGERVPADLVVLAIGYHLASNVAFLPRAFKSKLVDPRDGQYKLHRLIAHPELPQMGFVGFNSSFCSVLCADLAAEWLVRYGDGQLAKQPSSCEMHQGIDLMLEFKRKERPAAAVYGGLCVAPFHFKYFDELIDDIGCELRQRSNPLIEYMTPPDADAYGDFLASAPHYVARD